MHIEARASDVVEGGDDAEKSAEDNGEEAARRRHHGVEPERGEGRPAGAQHCILLVGKSFFESDKPVSLFKVTWVECDG